MQRPLKNAHFCSKPRQARILSATELWRINRPDEKLIGTGIHTLSILKIVIFAEPGDGAKGDLFQGPFRFFPAVSLPRGGRIYVRWLHNPGPDDTRDSLP